MYKTEFMKQIIFFKILLIFSAWGIGEKAQAQWREEFDSDLRYWTGDTAFFSCLDGHLVSRGPEKSSRLVLSRVFGPSGNPADRAFYQGVMKGDSAFSLEYALDLDFVPSSTNYIRLYLLCRDTALSDTSVAVYLHLGQKEGRNSWQLWKSGPDTSFLLWQGTNLFSRQSQMRMRVRAVVRPDVSSGRSGGVGGILGTGAFWSLYYSQDTGISARWYRDGDSIPADIFTQVLENRFQAFRLGLVCSYRTPSRATRYCVDHVRAGRLPREFPVRDSSGEGDRDKPISRFDSLSFLIPSFGRAGINELMFDPASGESRYAEFFNLSDTVFGLGRWALAIPDPDYAGMGLEAPDEEEIPAGLPAERRRTYVSASEKTGIPLASFFDFSLWKYYPLVADTFHLAYPGTYPTAAKDARKVSLQASACRENIFTAASFPTLQDRQGVLRLVWLPREGDSLLRDTVLLDEVFYTVESHHWLLSGTEGVSVERLDPQFTGMDPENWMSAAETSGFATPGCGNSHAYRVSEDLPDAYFSLDPPLVTPDNDGLNDFTLIRWNPHLDGFVCSMTVYDGLGRKVRQLCRQVILGAGGHIRYDAVDESGRVLRKGVYVLWIDLVKPDGKRKRLRLPLAVGE